MNDKPKHILEFSKAVHGPGTVCGTGPTASSVYDPTDATCENCLNKFKEKYPGSFEAWLRKKGKDHRENNTNS